MTEGQAATGVPAAQEDGKARVHPPDRRDGRVYVMPSRVELAVRVALATGRPLLLRGDPGSGKSSLASFVARQRGWRYYEHVVTSRTSARDLLWSFDTVRRLADAEARRGRGRLVDADYVEPGVLWWAFDPQSARRRGASTTRARVAVEPLTEENSDRSRQGVVVLIDEIDKADPDVPNALLVPLGSQEFVVTDTGAVVRKSLSTSAPEGEPRQLLVLITTNEERELPPAFLRRCVVLWLDHPEVEHLVAIARAHLLEYEGTWEKKDEALARALAGELVSLRQDAERKKLRPPSTAEFLDALRACRSEGITVGSDRWHDLRELTLLKPQQKPVPPPMSRGREV